ncbi:MAG: GtrA family protein [Prevotella sp.]
MKITRNNIYEIMRFAMVGVLATAIHYGVYLLLRCVIDFNIAYTIGYFVSFIFNYILSACFTFKKKKSLKNGVGFCLAHAFNYVLQLALLNVFIFIGIAAWLAPVPVYCIAIPTNFLIVRYVFRHVR